MGESSIAAGEVVLIDIDDLNPSPENEDIYRRISVEDPAIIELAASIEKDGVLQPLTITTDKYILSGHRRHTAAEIAGLWEVPCRTVSIMRDDPRFTRLLREFNRQRTKGVDEILHEALIDVDEESLRVYRAHALEQQIGGDDRFGQSPITAGESRKRFRISKAKRQFADAIKQVIGARHEYWPLSVRAVHYALLNERPLRNAKTPTSLYSNDKLSYQDLSNVLTRLRLNCEVPWRAISDDTRPVAEWTEWPSPAGFIGEQVSGFLNDYSRDCLQSQPAYIEVLAEKLTIEPVIRPVCAEFGMPYMIGRGFSSIDARFKLTERFHGSGKVHIILLILSDHDPDGEEIAANFVKSLRDDFDICESQIHATKVALTAEQVQRYNLPHTMDAKKSSSRYKKFAEQFGDHAYEMEALNPADLQKILRDSIESALDIDLYNAEVAAAEEDEKHIIQTKAKAAKLLRGICP